MRLLLLARSYSTLTQEIEVIEGEPERLAAEFAPAPTEIRGIGPDTATTPLTTAGSHPLRLNSEASFAALCRVSPVPAA
jgi:transposase